MSLRTWVWEFYPTKPTKRMTALEATEHSLQKWKGLTKTNLRKHKVGNNESYDLISETTETDTDKMFSIDASTCALCKKFYGATTAYNPCNNCPIVRFSGKTCLEKFEDYLKNGDPKPMIKLLTQTRNWLKKEGKK